MLQFSGTLRSTTVWLTPLSSWRLHNQQSLAACSGATNPSSIQPQLKEDEPRASKPTKKSQNSMIKAAFDTLKIDKFDPNSTVQGTVSTSEIEAATSIDDFLKIADDKYITRDKALAVITKLIESVNNDKVKLRNFETDSRFLHLCSLLSRPSMPQVSDYKKKLTTKYPDELNMFYGTPEINDATMEVANITVKQMIKVMSSLASQKKRSTPLLKSLSFNISQSTEVLNVKQLSDLLYSMAILNYPDEVLLTKICTALIWSVQDVNNTALIGSILTSLGRLRYKNEQLMDRLSEWAVVCVNEMRAQDLCSFFMTLATLGYTPTNIDALKKFVIEPLKETDMTKPTDWLDIVWAFTILGLAEHRHIASVLDSNFIRNMEDSNEISVPKRHKLLNINGAAQSLLKNYKGPLLDSSSELFNSPAARSKEKQIYVKAITGTLEIIFPPPEYLKTNVDIGVGCLLDAEFCIDADGKRLPVKNDMEKRKGFRIAVIAQYYHDFCRGKQDPVGFYNLFFRILEAKGYKIFLMPHTEFPSESKIIHRLAYVNERIKTIEK